MPRLPRFDTPGRWFHVMNRGLAKRPVFESRQDIRYFLSRLARAVRRNQIELHAFALLTTHFHLLVRSPVGELSEAMRRAQNEFVRYFNRTRRRDGPLFRGRFFSKPVLSKRYRRVLVRYIDHNPVQARLAPAPWEYPYGSAYYFAGRRVPPWLCAKWVMQGVTHASRYAERWGYPLSGYESELVRSRIVVGGRADDPLDDLVGAAPERVRAWMARKSRLADGTRPGIPIVSASAVVFAAEEARRQGLDWRYTTEQGQRRTAWPIAVAALLRLLSGQTLREIADRLSVTSSAITRRLRMHASLVERPEYSTVLGEVADRCLRTAWPDEYGKVRNRS